MCLFPFANERIFNYNYKNPFPFCKIYKLKIASWNTCNTPISLIRNKYLSSFELKPHALKYRSYDILEIPIFSWCFRMLGKLSVLLCEFTKIRMLPFAVNVGFYYFFLLIRLIINLKLNKINIIQFNDSIKNLR